MTLSHVAMALWAAGLFGNAALLAILLLRSRNRVVPWFTGWVSFNLLFTIVLFATYRLATKQTYTYVYWSGAFVDLTLQVAIVLEIARYVFRRGDRWVGDARARLFSAGVVAIVAGVLMAAMMKPITSSKLAAWGARADLGCTVLITLLFTAVMVVSHQLGVSWRSLVLREGYGVAVWSVVSFITDTLYAYWRTASHFTFLDDIRIAVYLGALGYWAITFWLPESLPVVTESVTKRRLALAKEALEYRQAGSSRSR